MKRAIISLAAFAAFCATVGMIHLTSRSAEAAAIEEGVSAVTMTTEGGVSVKNINTMPCNNAATIAMVASARSHYLPDTKENAAKRAAYGKKVGMILTENRKFSKELSKVCSYLVVAAEESSRDK